MKVSVVVKECKNPNDFKKVARMLEKEAAKYRTMVKLWRSASKVRKPRSTRQSKAA